MRSNEDMWIFFVLQPCYFWIGASLGGISTCLISHYKYPPPPLILVVIHLHSRSHNNGRSFRSLSLSRSLSVSCLASLLLFWIHRRVRASNQVRMARTGRRTRENCGSNNQAGASGYQRHHREIGRRRRSRIPHQPRAGVGERCRGRRFSPEDWLGPSQRVPSPSLCAVCVCVCVCLGVGLSASAFPGCT